MNMEMVIGLEVHVELKTQTKMFCGCKNDPHAEPNTLCCPVCMGLPGALPTLNRKAVELATRAGLALNCTISQDSRFERKNYFYPDLPKAYQISQYEKPLSASGWLDVQGEDGERHIGITRVHMEEDAGKLTHEGDSTLIDLNRCGVPLIEIVTEPDFRSADEVKSFLRKLRAILVCAKVSDCRMDEGSMRCDVNLSVREHGAEKLGERTEMKNLNSIAFAGKAIEYEYRRQVDAIRAGEPIVQDTRRFDPATGRTLAMRSKENAEDYRYFPDPDLPPVLLDDTWITQMRETLPELPDEKQKRFQREFALSARDAASLCADAERCAAFEKFAPAVREPARLCALLGALPGETVPGGIERIADMVSTGALSPASAKRVLIEMDKTGEPPERVIEALALTRIDDESALRAAAQQAIAENASLAAKYLGGKEGALMALMGAVMRLTGGQAQPEMALAMLRECLAQR